MANTHNVVTGWTDTDPDSRFRNSVPTTIILADDIANGEYDSLLGDVFQAGLERNGVYVDENGQRWPMGLVLYVHPVGAGALTIRVGATSACRGKFLLETGAFTGGAPVQNALVAGAMLSQYSETTSEIGSTTVREPVWSTALQEGDAIWLVRRGRYFALTDLDGACTLRHNACLDNSNGTNGAVQDTSNMPGPLAAQILENLPVGQGGAVGTFYENGGTTLAGFVDMLVDMPPRYMR